MKSKIVIVDYGVGNTLSVFNAIKQLGYHVAVSKDASDIDNAAALVLPGVGAFEAAMNNIRKYHLDEMLNEQVLVKQKPIIGICLGMQLMATTSEENGIHNGLNWIPGNVIKLDLPREFSVPHVGWNDLTIHKKDPVFARVDEKPHYYFDHSYHYNCDQQHIAAVTEYGGKSVVSAIKKDNIHGVQFHPEKSQNNGLKLFRGFFNSIQSL